MPIYQSKGQLVAAIEEENVPTAQQFLTEDPMAKYLDEPLRSVVERLEWRLAHNGLDYVVEAVTTRELTEDELAKLADEVSGQNSDGLGETFEQQDWAWVDAVDSDDEEEYDEGRMASFDWKTNKSVFTRVV